MKLFSMALLVVSLIIVGTVPAAAAAAKPAAGGPAPAFTLNDLAGNEVSLSQFKGKPVLVHFWATWCGSCRHEMPQLQEISRERSADVVVLGINFGERKKVVTAYAKEQGIAFPVLLDSRGKAASLYDVITIPATFLVGPDGAVARKIPMDELSLAEIDKYLGQLGKPAP